MRSADDRVIIASIETANARIMELLDKKDEKKLKFYNDFKELISKKPEDVRKDWEKIEKKWGEAQSSVGFGNTDVLNEAIRMVREEVYFYTHERYFLEALLVLHNTFDVEFGRAHSEDERVSLILREYLVKLADKATRMIEEVQTTEYVGELTD